MRAKWLLSVCGLCVACSGSGDDGGFDSEIMNEDAPIRAAIQAVGAQGETTVTVQMVEAANLFETVELAQGDVLKARAGEREVTLVENDGWQGGYVGILPGDAAGTKVVITLTSETLGDATATVVLPEHLTLTAPSAADAPDLEEPIELTWKDGKPGDRATAVYELDCARGQGMGNASDGQDRSRQSIDIEPKGLEGPCDVTLEVHRQDFGELSGSWGGFALGAQKDTVSYSDVEL